MKKADNYVLRIVQPIFEPLQLLVSVLSFFCVTAKIVESALLFNSADNA